MAALTFTEYTPAHPSKTPGKVVPPKLKTADGTEYACGKDVNLPLVIGQAYECVVTSKQNGQYINHYLESAIPLAAYSPPANPQPLAPANGNGHAAPVAPPAKKDDYWRPRDPKEELRIIRQSVLKSATELVTAGHLQPDAIFAKADEMVKWVYTGNPAGIPAQRPALTPAPAGSSAPPPPSDEDYPWR